MEQDHLTAKLIHENIETHIHDITGEFRNGFEFLRKYPKSVTIFGSARTKPDSAHYKTAHELGSRIAKELRYAVITGGGPGIMEAANKGAHDAGGVSIGLTIKLPAEQHTNRFANKELHFDYFFSRKAMLTFAAEAFVFFPGGFGTFDELFGIITLIQTHKIPRVPVFLVGQDFWSPLKHYIQSEMLDKHSTINPEDIKLFHITDHLDTVINTIKNAPVSEWWKTMD